MLRDKVKILLPFLLLVSLPGRTEEMDELKSQIESLKEEINKLFQAVVALEGEVKGIKELASNSPKKNKKLPNQHDFTEGGNLPVMGSSEARIAIIEFSDFQCPYCKRFADNTFKQLKENYIDTGKVQYIARDFPLNFHPQAMPAAIVATCSFKQNSYWEMRDLIFSNAKQLGEEFYQKSAKDLSLDMDKFAQCIGDQSVEEKVKKDLAIRTIVGCSGYT